MLLYLPWYCIKVLRVRASALTPRLWTPPLVVWTKTLYFLPGVRPTNLYLVFPAGWEQFVTRLPLLSKTCRLYPLAMPRASCQFTWRLQVLWKFSTWSPVTSEGTAHRYTGTVTLTYLTLMYSYTQLIILLLYILDFLLLYTGYRYNHIPHYHHVLLFDSFILFLLFKFTTFCCFFLC